MKCKGNYHTCKRALELQAPAATSKTGLGEQIKRIQKGGPFKIKEVQGTARVHATTPNGQQPSVSLCQGVSKAHWRRTSTAQHSKVVS